MPNHSSPNNDILANARETLAWELARLSRQIKEVEALSLIVGLPLMAGVASVFSDQAERSLNILCSRLYEA